MYERVFSKSGLSLDRLRVLAELGDAGSIAKAAGGDPVRQSQYSRQLKELESCFGVALTRRQGRGLALTDAGRRLAKLARESLTGLDDFIAAADGQAVHMSVGAGDSLIHWLLMPKMAAFSKEFPAVGVAVYNLRSGEIMERLRDRSLDFGLLRAPEKAADIRQAPLGTLAYRLFVPKGLMAAKGAASADLPKGIPLALPGADTELGREIRAALALGKADALPALEAESFPELLSALLAGGHAAVLPSIAATAATLTGAVPFDPPWLRGGRRKIALCWSARLESTRPGMEKVRRWLAKAFAFG